MSRRGTTRLAWAVCAIAIALAFAALVFLILNSSTPGVSNFGSSRIGDALFGVVVLTFPAVGALVASRRPQNPIGWIFVGLGSLFAVAAFANQYALYALLTEPGSLPAGETMAWLGSWLLLPPLFLAATLLFLLFPEGRLLSRRWVPVVWIVVGAIVLALLGEMFSPHTLEDFQPLTNPYATEGALADALESVANVASILMFVGIVVSATSLVLRFRRATGVERQQLKWVASAAGLVGATFASGPLLFWYIDDGAVWEPLLLLAIATIPVTAGFAILRYRLYEIDRIVNRAVVYGAVSALLVGVYFGTVLGLQEVFSSFGGGSDLAIAVSTLAVAALFRPVRARVQRAVDRRFYRRGYDAQRTLEAFSARLRDEIDIAALHGELTAVVRRTLEPERVSLWLRPAVTDAVTPAGRRGRTTGAQQ
jgi:hypothetical protein